MNPIQPLLLGVCSKMREILRLRALLYSSIYCHISGPVSVLRYNDRDTPFKVNRHCGPMPYLKVKPVIQVSEYKFRGLTLEAKVDTFAITP